MSAFHSPNILVADLIVFTILSQYCVQEKKIYRCLNEELVPMESRNVTNVYNSALIK